jgi:hypothetical protein
VHVVVGDEDDEGWVVGGSGQAYRMIVKRGGGRVLVRGNHSRIWRLLGRKEAKEGDDKPKDCVADRFRKRDLLYDDDGYAGCS